MDCLDHILVNEVETGGWFQSLMFEISTRFVNLPVNEVDAAIERAQRLLCEGFGLDRSTLWQKSPGQGHILRLTHAYQSAGQPEIMEASDQQLLSHSDWILNDSDMIPALYKRMEEKTCFPWVFEQIERGKTVVIKKLEDLPPAARRDREGLLRYGVKSTVIVPLGIKEAWRGCLAFTSTQLERDWSKESVKKFELTGHLFANALARKSSDLALRENATRLQLILDSAVEGIITIDVHGRIESANAKMEHLFGYGASELIGQNVQILMPMPFSAEHDPLFEDYLRSGEADIIGVGREFIGRRKDGSLFPVELAISEMTLGERRLFNGFLYDLTERKEAEASLRESDARFRGLADSAPVLIWMSDQNNQYFFFNKRWLDFTGRALSEESGTGWAAGIHPADIESYMETCAKAFDSRQSFVLQCRLRRHDGTYRWIANSGLPHYGKDGCFCGYIGSCVDVTERIEAEESARDMAGRLINAQEQERARLARELHDDVTQRLARLAIDAGRIERANLSGSDTDNLVKGVREGLVRLSEDVHAMSYKLHPSAIIDLGLVDALKAECEQFSAWESIIAKATFRNLPPAIPSDMAIGLFRIAQESLRNASRHGRASKATVSLWGVEDGLQLVVEDNGIGFDPNQQRNRPSLGLASMRERARCSAARFLWRANPILARPLSHGCH